MTTFTSTDGLKTRLLETQLETHFLKGKSLTLHDVEDLCATLFEDIGVDSSIQAKLEEYFLRPDGYCIDAETALKSLGIVLTFDALVHAGVLPHSVNNEINDAMTSSETIPVFQNNMCEIYQCKNAIGETAQGVLLRRPVIKYMITKRSLYKVLQSVTDHDRFRNYFALKYELAMIYKEYQIKCSAREEEIARRRIVAVQDTFRNGILSSLQALEKKIDTNNGTLDASTTELNHFINRVGAMASALYKYHTEQNSA